MTVKELFQPVSVVYVYFMAAGDKRLMGRLLLKERKIFFEYDVSFLNTGLQLSPFKLPPTMIMGEGKTPTLLHLLKLAELGDIKKNTALKLLMK